MLKRSLSQVLVLSFCMMSLGWLDCSKTTTKEGETTEKILSESRTEKATPPENARELQEQKSDAGEPSSDIGGKETPKETSAETQKETMLSERRPEQLPHEKAPEGLEKGVEQVLPDPAVSDSQSQEQRPVDLVVKETSPDQPEKCAAGTCRVSPNGKCEKPGGPLGNGCCECDTDGTCKARCICNPPNSLIATPSGEKPIASLQPGDLVYSVHRAQIVAVPIQKIARVFVGGLGHVVVQASLANGLQIVSSPGHPTADGRRFSHLRAGQQLDGYLISRTALVAYPFSHTHDILPRSDTGSYFVNGVRIGSTLFANCRSFRQSTPK